MKTLALLRHGKSSWDEEGISDFDRHLKRRGRTASLSIGQEISRRGLNFDLVIASPAKRVTETLDLVEEGFGSRFEVRVDPRIYEATPVLLLKIVQAVDDEVRSVLLVGHNPGLQNLATTLAAADDPCLGEVAAHYPTAALVILRLPVESWRQIQAGTGEIVSFTIPRELGSATAESA